MGEGTRRKRGRPRDSGVADRIASATLELLSARGYAGLRIDDVARAAGVAKNTVYRRWPSLASLAVDAIASRIGERSHTPTGDPAADLRALCEELVAPLSRGGSSWLCAALGLHQHDDEALRAEYRRRIIDPPRLMLRNALERLNAVGRLSPAATPEAWADYIIGAAVYRIAILREPISADDVSSALDGIIVPAAPAPPGGPRPS